MKKTDTHFFAGLFLQYLILLSVAVAPTRAQPGTALTLSSSGSNQFRFADGYDNTDNQKRPWNYLVNSTDLQVGLGNLYTRLRFDIEEPSIGFDLLGQVHREYLSRRTLGYDNGTLLFEAGNVMTQFGRGLSLSLKEDREVELYSLLDGIYGQLQLPLLSIQGIAGRPWQWTNTPFTLVTKNGTHQDTLQLLDDKNLQMRDMIAGGYAEFFLPDESSYLPFISSGSLGGGLVYFATNVENPVRGFHDSENFEDPFWYQNRTARYIPSVTGTVGTGNATLSVEQSWLNGTVHSYTPQTDTTLAFESVTNSPNGSATYVSLSGALSTVTILAEYKNYFYDRSEVFTKDISTFLCPPQVRYLHSWHLLNKTLRSNLMDNTIGYNILTTWTPDERSQLIFNASYGGRHDGDDYLNIDRKTVYWEGYAEWSREMADGKLHGKVAIDWGRLDPFQQKITYRTLAAEALFGPVRNVHSFGITIESQLNSKPFLAEKSREALISLIVDNAPTNALNPETDPVTGILSVPDTLLYDRYVPDDRRSRYTQHAFNLLTTLSWSWSPWLSFAVTVEREAQPEELDNIHIVEDLASPRKYYTSCALRLNPHPNHMITIEYGSMSGGKKCTLGTCVDLPPFEGLKVEVTSAL